MITGLRTGAGGGARIIAMVMRILALLALAWAGSAGAFSTPTPYYVVEYVNEVTGHYRLAGWDTRALDNGGEDGRWVRTGHVFTQYTFGQLGEVPVCRFHSPVHGTYYYTPRPAECAALFQPGSGWVYQGNDFSAPPATSTGCPSSVAVRRLWDGLAGFRFSADPATIVKMLQRGWTDEGIGFCAYAVGLAPERSFDAYSSGAPKDLSECEAKVGPCVATQHLAPMTRRIPPLLPPSYIQRNDAYPSILNDVIGVSGLDLYTSREGGAPDVMQHSLYTETGGVYLTGIDRLSGPYASLSLMYQLEGGVGPTSDERLFPWRNGRERDLMITSTISVTTLTRGHASSDAYGMQLIHFADRVSGRRFYVTLQAFGVAPGGDYIGADYSTGRAIVSTSYRENPLFGRRILGNVARCNVDSPEDCLPRTTFTFQLSKADFQAILGHARRVDPLLTADPANYFVSSFHQHNETYLDAVIGMATVRLNLSIWPRVQ
jgi:hypothetical protein